jgi:hypothetical protein
MKTEGRNLVTMSLSTAFLPKPTCVCLTPKTQRQSIVYETVAADLRTTITIPSPPPLLRLVQAKGNP